MLFHFHDKKFPSFTNICTREKQTIFNKKIKIHLRKQLHHILTFKLKSFEKYNRLNIII
jgi:hypothetical protein